MPNLLKHLTAARTLLLAASFLLIAFAVRAQDSTTTPSTVAPSTPLPAAGGNQEPTPPKTAPGSADANNAAPAIKPMTVHAERDAEIGRIVGRLVEEDHYLQVPITAEMSQRWLKNYLQALDYNHLFFLQSDVDEFTAKYGNTLGDLLMHSDDESVAIAPAFDIFKRYLQRVNDNVALAKSLLNDKYDFNKDENFTVPTDKSPWLKDAAYSDSIWRLQIKADLLNGVLDKKAPADTDKRLAKRYDSLLREREEMDDMDVLELYLSALTHAYDPHSDYFQPEEAQNFNIQAINHSVTGIGAILEEDDGYAKIEEVIPGGPADLDKRLQAGDRIIAVGQGSKEPVDAVNMRLNRVVDMIRGEKGSMVKLVIIPAGASEAVHKDIILKRDMVSIKDSLAKADIIQHQLPDGTMEKVGVIVLHDFYNNSENHHSAASDVAELIQRLKKENVSGIILDMRNNGGGLLDQAIDLTGLFVKREYVVQVKRSDGFIDQLEPDDNEDIYNGPLLVMVNKASASATEIVAGALQDYGRAVVVGDASTHGKGTVQTLIPLAQQEPIGWSAGDPGSLKLTVQKFYRVAGGSTQQKGVIPDIILPSILDGFELGETTLPYYLPYDTIAPTTFEYLNLAAPYLPALKADSAARVAASSDFDYLRERIAYFKKRMQDPTVSLNEAVRLKEKADLKAEDEQHKKDLAAHAATRDKELELTLDMVENNLPAAAPVDKKPKIAASDDDDSSADADLDADDTVANADDPQLNESVDIMCDYTAMLRGAGSKLVQAQSGK
jgi:carboxyl-terminal processing protease